MTKAEICSKVRTAVSILPQTSHKMTDNSKSGRAYTISISLKTSLRFLTTNNCCKFQQIYCMSFQDRYKLCLHRQETFFRLVKVS